MFIEYEYRQIEVPQEIIEFCDYFTYDANHEDLSTPTMLVKYADGDYSS